MQTGQAQLNYKNIKLDKTGSTPLYRQVAEQIKLAVAEKQLAAGSKLLPIRKMAAALEVSPITITQAYELLAVEGIVGGQVGRGTFILPESSVTQISPVLNTMENSAKNNSNNWASGLRNNVRASRSVEMQQYVQRAVERRGSPHDLINLVSGNPDPQLFALARWRQAMTQAGKALEKAGEKPGGNTALQYSSALGDEELRRFLANYFSKFGFQPHPDEVMLTTGSQQSLDLIARVFIEPGDPIFVENFSYIAALDIFEQARVSWKTVPFDQNGLQVEALEHLLEAPHSRPRLVYTVPTAHSPTGYNLSLERRHKLAELARRYNLLIIEDDVCNEYYYEGNQIAPTVRSFEPGGRVIYLKSFSKTIFPAVRLGCIVAFEPVLAHLAQGKQLFDRASSVPLAQTVLKHINTPAYEQELKHFRNIYRQRRDVALAAVERELAGSGCGWTIPMAGFSMLLTLPDGLDELQVAEEAASQGVIVVPGRLFAPPQAGNRENTIRLTFGDKSAEQMEEGVRRLAVTLRSMLQGKSRLSPSTLSMMAAV